MCRDVAYNTLVVTCAQAPTTGRILLVDDDESIIRVLRIALKIHGFEADVSRSGHEALEAAVKGCYELLLVDLGLPGLDGFGVIRQVREWSRIPIIVASARDERLARDAALAAGANDYLAKPFAVGELLVRISTLLQPSPEMRIS